METEGLDLRLYGRIFAQWWWVLLLSSVMLGVAGYGYSNTITPVYEATSKVLVQSSRSPGLPTASDLQAGQQLLANLQDLVMTRANLERTAELTGVSASRVSEGVRVLTNRSLLFIIMRDQDPVLAATIANELAETFIDDYQARQLTQIAQFQAALSQYGIRDDGNIIAAQASTLSSVSVLEKANPPLFPVIPRVRLNVALSAIGGLLIAAVVIFGFEYLNDKVKSLEQIKAVTGMSVLGAVQRYRPGVLGTPRAAGGSQRGNTSQAYDFLYTNLEFAAVGGGNFRTVLVTSSVPEEGKTTTAVNLALAAAQHGRTVILVDADMRKPALHRLFELGDAKGLSHLLVGSVTLDEALLPTSTPGLRIIATGVSPADPSPMLRSARMREILDQVKSHASLVVIDCPPLLAVTDPLLLSPLVDVVLFVVGAGEVRAGQLKQAADLVLQTNPPTLGAVLNKATAGRSRAYSYYYYYSSYGDDADRTNGHARRRPWQPLTKLFSRRKAKAAR